MPQCSSQKKNIISAYNIFPTPVVLLGHSNVPLVFPKKKEEFLENISVFDNNVFKKDNWKKNHREDRECLIKNDEEQFWLIWKKISKNQFVSPSAVKSTSFGENDTKNLPVFHCPCEDFLLQ